MIDHMTKVYKKFTITEGLNHHYLGMDFMFDRTQGTVRISMDRFVEETLGQFGGAGESVSPAASYLFRVSENSDPLDEEGKKKFHTFTAKLLYLSKRVRPDISTAVAFLTTRVQCPTVEDRKKLCRVMDYLNATKTLNLTLGSFEDGAVSVYIDASFDVHPKRVSHSGVLIYTGPNGCVFAKSTKQKLVSKSSTEAELIAVSDGISQAIWTRNFLCEQRNISSKTVSRLPPAQVYQDNKSTIQLIKNGRSNSANTRHIDRRFFFVKDRVDSGDIVIRYLPTDDMVADVMTKPLQGAKFERFRAKLLGMQMEEK
ncbi:MAG: Ty1/Copia family ribonuclease HI [Micrococcales bacterium]|nr:Ty1/Copia family ribonuclease HI [Micrococcales bacterium]